MSKTLRGRRWTGWSKRRPSLVRPFPSLRVEELEARAVPAAFTWTGAGLNTNWSNPANWSSVVPNTAPSGNPLNNDSLNFPLNVAVKNTNNDILNGTFFSITISGNNYALAGKSLTLGSATATGNITVGTAVTGSHIDLDVVLGAAAGNKQFFTVGNNSDLLVNGKLSGTTGSILTKDGNGLLILAADNSGFTGDILVNDNGGPLEIRNVNALGNITGTTTVGVNGTLQLRDLTTPVFETLTLNGPGASNLGALTSVAGTANTWAGSVIADSDTTFGAAIGTSLRISGQISDLGAGHNITKEDLGEVIFSASNTYRGFTRINDGTLTITDANALGAADRTAATGTVVNETLTKAGQLRLGSTLFGSGFTVLNERLLLNGDGLIGGQGPIGSGSLFNAAGNNEWAGPVLLGSGVSSATYVAIGGAAGTDLIVSGNVVDGPSVPQSFRLQKVQPGRLIFNNVNTYNGRTTVVAGILNLRDSNALGPTSPLDPAIVNTGATIQLEVEPSPPAPFGYDQGTGSATGRDLRADSVTGDPNRLTINRDVVLSGLGAGNLGALHSLSGINLWTGTINLVGNAGIGVAPDTRAGHPTPTAAYFTDDYSLTPTQAIFGNTLVKRDSGHLILSSSDSYTGRTLIQQGWITIRTPDALSSTDTVVSDGAALHLYPNPVGTSFTIFQDLTLSGNGISHPYGFIGGKGALMNLSGNNVWGANSVDGNGDIVLAGTSGIGVEAVFPLGNSPSASSLRINTSISQSAAGSGLNKWGSQRLTLFGDGTYSGAVNINEGVLRAANDTALGWATSGTFNSQQTYTQTNTTVAPGGVLELATVPANNNGGISAGIRVPDEGLVLNGQGQQLAVAGDPTNPFALFTITYTSPTAGNFTTVPIHITATAQEVQDALNFVDPVTQTTPSLVATDGQTALVTRVGNVFRIAFGSVLAADVPPITATAVPPPPGFTAAEMRVTDGTHSVSNVSNDNSWRGPVTLLGGSRISSAANTRLSLLGTIDDSAPASAPSDLTKRGTGDLLLAGTNTYRGQTFISQGVVTAMSGLAFGFGDATAGTGTIIADNAQLQLDGGLTFAAESLTVQGTGTPTASALTNQWFNVGPTPTNNGQSGQNRPTSGRITSIAADPTNADYMYVATAGGGAWKTKDGGLTWHPLFENTTHALATMYGSQIVIASDGTLYFATGEANGVANGNIIPGPNDNYVGSGVYRSTNSGVTWTLLVGSDGQNPLQGQSVTKLIVDPMNSGRIYAASSTLNAANTYQTGPTPIAGIYRYENGEWYNLTANASPRRLGNLGQAPFDAAVDDNTGLQSPGAPGNAGPDDDYRIKFPQGGAVAWSDIYLVREGFDTNPAGGTTANTDANGNSYVLYAALGRSGQNPFFWSGTIGDPITQGVFNAVYRTENPFDENPTWWLGAGTIYPIVGQTATLSDQRDEDSYYPIGAVTATGPHEWIKLAGTITNYNTAFVNPSITLYASSLNAAAGRTGEFLDIQIASTTGGLTGVWAPGGAIPASVAPNGPFGVNNPIAIPPTYATGYYNNALFLPDTNPGLAVAGASLPNTLYLGGLDAIYRTTIPTTGVDWTDLYATVGVVAPAGNVHTMFLASDPGNPNVATRQVLAGTDGGIWRFNPTTLGFSNLNGTLSVTQLSAVDPHPTDLNQAYGASGNNGLQQFDGSLDWSRVNLAVGNGASAGDNATVVRYDSVNPLIAYAVQNGIIYKTLNNGASWNPIRTASVNSTGVPLVVDPLNTSRLLVGGGGLFESTNGGGGFIGLNAPFDPTVIAAASYQGGFTADPAFPFVTDKLSNSYDPETIYATNGTSIAVTKDRGLTWASGAARTPTIIDNRWRINFDGYLRYKQIPEITVTGSPGVYPTVKTLVDGFPAMNGYAGDSETQSVEVVTTNAAGTFQITFTYDDVPGVGVVTFTTAALSVNSTTAQVQTAINNALTASGMTGPEILRIETRITGASPTMKLMYQQVESADIPLTGLDDSAAINAALAAMVPVPPYTVTWTGTPGVYLATSTTNGIRPLMYATGQTAVEVNVYEIQEGGPARVNVRGFGDEVATITAQYALPDPGAAMTFVFEGIPFGPYVLSATTAATIQADLNAYLIDRGTVTVTKTTTDTPAPPATATLRTDVYTITFNGGQLADQNQDNILTPALLQVNTQSVITTIVNGGRTTGSGITFTNLVVNQADRDEIFAMGRYRNSQNGPVLFRSTDAGQTWTDITGNLPTVQTWTGAFDPRSETLYVGGDQGVYRLTNAVDTGTFTWTHFGNGLENVQVHDLVLNQTLNTLTAATYGRGMMQLFLTDYRANSGAIRAISGNSTWGGPVTLTGNVRIDVDGTQNVQNGISAASLNILGVISDGPGDFNITKEGQGTLIFSGANTYGGVTDIQHGVLQVNNPLALGDFDAASNTIVRQDLTTGGAALELATDLFREPVTVFGNGFTFNGHFTGALRNVSGFNTYTGPLTMATDSTIGVNSTTQLTIGAKDGDTLYVNGNGSIGEIPSTRALNKELTGTLVLGNANTYNGGTNVIQGALRVGHANALGTLAFNTQVYDGAQMQISRNNVTHAPTVIDEILLLAGTGINGTGALLNVRGDSDPGTNDNTWRGLIQLGQQGQFSPPTFPPREIALGTSDSRDTLFIGSTTGGGLLELGAGFVIDKVGPGRITFVRANSYTGQTNVNEGTLRIMNNGSLGSTGPGNPGTVVNSGATLELDNSNSVLTPTEILTIFGDGTATGIGALHNAVGDNPYNGPITIGSSITASISAAAGTELTINGALQDPVQAAVPATNPDHGRFRKSGAGTVVLPTAKTYSGATLVAQGVLNIRTEQALGTPHNEVQFVQVTATVGSFALSFKGQSTNFIRFDATAGEVETALEGLSTMAGSSVAVALIPGAGINTYRIEFDGGPLQNTDQPSIIPISIAPSFGTTTNGTVSTPEVQRFTVQAPSGWFALTWNGLRTDAIPVNASQAAVEAAIEGLGTGNVTVVRTGATNNFTYTVTWVASGNQPFQLGSLVVGGTTVIQGTNTQGQRGTTVASGATLQIQGTQTFSFPATGELITLNGQGFNSQGALNVVAGTVTFNVPLLLGSDASVGASGAGDRLVINTVIAETAPGSDLDIYGLGTVRFNGNGTGSYSGTSYNTYYTGTTTVNSGLLELNVTTQPPVLGPLVVGDGAGAAAAVIELLPNQVADTSTVRINSDGSFDLNGLVDTFSDLTMVGGDLFTRDNGQLTTGNIDMSAGAEVFVGNNAKLTGGAAEMTNSDMFVGANSIVTLNGDLFMDASDIQFATPGPATLAVAGNITMLNGSNILWNGTPGVLVLTALDLLLNASTIDLNDDSSIAARNVTLLNSALIDFDNRGKFTASGAVSATNSDITFDLDGRFNIAGNLLLNNGRIAMGAATGANAIPPLTPATTLATLTTGRIDMSGGTSKIDIGDRGYLTANGPVTNAAGTIQFHNDGRFVAVGNLALTAGAKVDFGTHGFFDNQSFDVSMDSSTFNMADGLSLIAPSTAKTRNLAVANGSKFTFGNFGYLDVLGTLGVTPGIFGNSELTFVDNGLANVVGDVTVTGGKIAFVDNGTLNTGKVTNTGGKIAFDDAGTFSATGPVTVTAGGSIGFGTNPTTAPAVTGGLNGNFSTTGSLALDAAQFWMGANGTADSNGLGLTNASKVTFDANGTYDATSGPLTMSGASEIRFGNTGKLLSGDLTQNTGLIDFLDNGTLDPANVLLTAATINFDNNGAFTPGNVNSTNSFINFGTTGKFDAAGNVSFAKTALAMGTGADVDMLALTTTGATTITLGDNSAMNTTNATVTGPSAVLSFGGNNTWTAVGTVSLTSAAGTFGPDSKLKVNGTLNLSGSTLDFGTPGLVEVTGAGNANLSSASKITFADQGTFHTVGDVTMIGVSKLVYGTKGTLDVNDLSITTGSIAMGAEANIVGSGTGNIASAAVSIGNDGTIDFAGDVTIAPSGAGVPSLTTGTNAKVETGKLTVTSGNVTIGAGGKTTTADITVTGTSKMQFGANNELNAGNVTSTTGTWTFGNTSTMKSTGNVSLTNGAMTFGTVGVLEADGDLSLNNTPLTFGITGKVEVEDVFITNKSKLTFGNSGTLLAEGTPPASHTGTISLNNGQIRFNNIGSMTGGDVILVDSSVLGGNSIALDLDSLNMDPSTFTLGDGSGGVIAGPVDITDGAITMGSNVILAVTGDFTSQDAALTFGNSGKLTVGGKFSLDHGSATFGSGYEFTSVGKATLTDTSFTQSDLGKFTTADLAMTDSLLNLATDIEGSVQNFSIVNSTANLGAGTELAIAGSVFADSSFSGTSAIIGDGAVDFGSTVHGFDVGDGDLADDVDFAIFSGILSSDPARLVKTGAGRVDLAPQSGSTIDIEIQAGDVQVTTSAGDVLLAGGTLSGTGLVGTLDGTGAAPSTVAPGNNWNFTTTGILAAGNTTWGPQTTFNVDLSSSSPGNPQYGTDYDVLEVNGNIELGGALLTANYGPGITLNDSFTIVNATGSVTGKFQQFNNQDILFVAGQKFTIEYTPSSVILHKVLATATVSMTAAPLTSTLRQPVLLTAVVVPELGSSLFSGTINLTFFDDGGAMATVPVNLVGSQFVATYTTLPLDLEVGNNVLTATFLGDADNFAPASTQPPDVVAVVEQPFASTIGKSQTHISPNNPTSIGVQDSIAFTSAANAERGSINWTLDIRNPSSTVVRTLSGSGGPSGTFIPINTTWDGRNGSGNFTGITDGTYTATLTVNDSFGNTYSPAVSTFIVDNTTPTATLPAPSNPAIDPTASSVLPGTTTFAGTVADTNLSGWVLSIMSGSTLIRSFSGTGPSANVIWNGLYDPTDATDPAAPTTQAPDGAYTVTLTANDLAGNTITSASQTVVVLANGPIVSLNAGANSVYGTTYTLTATASLPPGSPASLISLLEGDTVQFFRGATSLGFGTLAFNAGANAYQASFVVPLPSLGAGTYTDFNAVYVASTDFPRGQSPNATHTITPAPLDIVIHSQTRPYDSTNPVFTFTANTPVNGDTTAQAVVGSPGSGATSGTPAGTYATGPNSIGVGTLAPTSNYFFNSVTNGTLTITPKNVTIQIDDKSRFVNDPNPTFTFTVLNVRPGDPVPVSSLPMGTTATLTSPPGPYPITATGAPVMASGNYNVTSILPGTLNVLPRPTNFAIGSGASINPTDPSRVNIYSPGGTLIRSFTPFGSFSGGIRTAVGDFDGDHVQDTAVATGPGAVAQVTVFSGATGLPIFNTLPFDQFTGGVFIAAGDINADGIADIVVTPDEGGGPRVLAFKGGDFSPFISYFGIDDPNFRGGARAGVGDMNGDGFAEIAISAGFQGGPRIAVWDGKGLTNSQFTRVMPDFFAFDQSLRNGAYVAIGDVNGDGKGDLIAGAGPGGAPHVKIFDGASLINPGIGPGNTAPFASFFAGDQSNRGGVRVAAKVFDNDLYVDLLTGAGDAGGDRSTTYLGKDLKDGVALAQLDIDFPGLNNNGVFVG